MWRPLTVPDKATVLFALQYLKEHFDEAGAAMRDSIFFSRLTGEEVRPPSNTNEVQRLIQQILKGETAAEQVKVAYVLRDDDLDFKEGDTLEDVVGAGGALIDSCMDPPVAAFQVEGDDRWFVVSVECAIDEANPGLIREWIGDRMDDIETGIAAPLDGTDADDAEKELTFLRAELAKLPPRQGHADPPPPTDPGHHTYPFSEPGYDPERSDDENEAKVWWVNAPSETGVRYYASARCLMFDGSVLQEISKKDTDGGIDAVVDADGKVIWEAPWRRE